MKYRPLSIFGAIVAPIAGILFVLLGLPVAVASIWRLARRGWR